MFFYNRLKSAVQLSAIQGTAEQRKDDTDAKIRGKRPHQRGLTGNSQNARKFIAACNTMHQIIPKRILAKAKMKPETICGNTNRGASIKVSVVNSGNRKLEM